MHAPETRGRGYTDYDREDDESRPQRPQPDMVGRSQRGYRRQGHQMAIARNAYPGRQVVLNDGGGIEIHPAGNGSPRSIYQTYLERHSGRHDTGECGD